jgi:hypothetical protein
MRNSYNSYPAIVILITLFSGSQTSAKTGREAARGNGAPQAERPERGEGPPREKEDPKPCGRHVLPANIELLPYLAATLEEMYDRSATFRAQCQRIADVPHLRVSIQPDGWMRSSCRAFTTIRRRQRFVDAQVHLPPLGTMFAELIGHEFEHIIEQVEGLNLRELASVKGSGVHEVERDLFETDRAQRIGKIVADEVRTSRIVRPAAD